MHTPAERIAAFATALATANLIALNVFLWAAFLKWVMSV